MTNTTSPNRLNDRDRALEALRLRRDTAATWEQIATTCEYHSPATAQRAVARLANRIETTEVESYRSTFDAQLAFLWDQCQDRILSSSRGEMGFSQLIQAGVRIIDRRAKLHGVDAPIVVEASVVVSSQFDDEIQAMADAINARVEAATPAPVVDLVKHEVHA